MPRGDGTGPTGMGAMTGRAAGYCAGASEPGYAQPLLGRRYGVDMLRAGCCWGRGSGAGGGRLRNMFHATGLPGWKRMAGYSPFPGKEDPEIERQVLKNQADSLQSELEIVKKRLAEIEPKGSEG